MKKFILIVFAMIFILASASVSFAGIGLHLTGVGIEINNKAVNYTSDSGVPFIDGSNRTQVPFRVTMEDFGCKVSWDQKTKTAIAEKDGIKVEVPIGANYIIKNGTKISNDTAALIKDGRTYLPIRKVLEAFDAQIEWDNKSNIVRVFTQEENKSTEKKVLAEVQFTRHESAELDYYLLHGQKHDPGYYYVDKLKYDEKGNLVEYDNGLDPDFSFKYDTSGRLSEATDSWENRRYEFKYDKEGNLETITTVYILEEPEYVEDVITFDKQGRVKQTRCYDYDGNWHYKDFKYDSKGRLVSELGSRGNLDFPEAIFTNNEKFSENLKRSLHDIFYNDYNDYSSYTAFYEYDEAGRLIKVECYNSDDEAYAFTDNYKYNSNNQVKKRIREYASGIRDEQLYSYDKNGRLIGCESKGGKYPVVGGIMSVIRNLSYKYDNDGDVVEEKITDTFAENGLTYMEQTRKYTYKTITLEK
ncbi:MAG: copper amine oxidase N-terminal domain-containing protein [Clostridia bacterium]|nr:copper amine oxidase N-terminal domain-containing protein [Clostridia bacterium]